MTNTEEKTLLQQKIEELEKAKAACLFCLNHIDGRVDCHSLEYWAGVVERLRTEIKKLL